ncbi:hypothetical protein E2562_025599 [Oryza meyeriana var. granulata]|uniref:Uncharacterized protein n=1 Tax=Oryza meyeriana var. granulata TaxID=110450 RepID=A0A6G1E1K9_9ORYZ|nr:hypothetical protein E2562_025599 [Oryza meyeriana var. granulata]
MSLDDVHASACRQRPVKERPVKEQVVDSPPKRRGKKTFAEYQLQRLSDGVAQRSASYSLKRHRELDETECCMQISLRQDFRDLPYGNGVAEMSREEISVPG